MADTGHQRAGVSLSIQHGKDEISMTVAEAYKVHRNAVRNVGRDRGYTARGLEDALKVLNPFWAAKGSAYVTVEMIEAWDKEHSA